MKKSKRDIKLSIVVPCYKVEKYLPKCLDSLVAQTLNNIEIICINDGSPDNCLNILKEYRKKYSNKIIIIDKKNSGVWQARIDGIKKARGEYIGFVDSDDYVAPNYAEKLYQAAVKNQADIAICGFNRIDLDTNKVYSREMCKPKHITITVKDNPGLLLEINTSPWNKIYKANLLKNLPKLNKTPIVLEDVALLQLVYINTNKIVFTPKILYHYIVHNNSAIKTIKPSDLSNGQSTLKELRDLYISLNKDKEYLDYIDANAFLHLGISLMYRIYENNNTNFKKLFRENIIFLNQNFPNWLNNPYTTAKYIRKNNGSNKKLYITKKIYKFHLFKLFLIVYKTMINKFKIDIKW